MEQVQTQKKKPVIDMTPDERKAHVWNRNKKGLLEVIVEQYFGVVERVTQDPRYKGLPQYVQSAALATNFIAFRDSCKELRALNLSAEDMLDISKKAEKKSA
mgnify:FL=1